MTFEGNYQGVTGVGETSGDTYVGDGAGHDTFNDSFTNGQPTETFSEHFNAIGQGSDPTPASPSSRTSPSTQTAT